VVCADDVTALRGRMATRSPMRRVERTLAGNHTSTDHVGHADPSPSRRHDPEPVAPLPPRPTTRPRSPRRRIRAVHPTPRSTPRRTHPDRRVPNTPHPPVPRQDPRPTGRGRLDPCRARRAHPRVPRPPQVPASPPDPRRPRRSRTAVRRPPREGATGQTVTVPGGGADPHRGMTVGAGRYRPAAWHADRTTPRTAATGWRTRPGRRTHGALTLPDERRRQQGP